MNYRCLIFCGLLSTTFVVGAAGAPRLRAQRTPGIPPMFEENRGQFPAATKYLARSHGYQVSFESGAARIFTGSATPAELSFVSATAPQGVERMPTRLNYFQGSDPRQWVQGAAAYREIAYRSAGETALLFYWNTAGDLEFDLTLPPGKPELSPSFHLRGATAYRISEAGDLLIESGSSALTLRKPSVYQVRAGRRRAVKCSYVLGDDGLIGFDLGDYDHNFAVTIDPTLSITAGTYLGGSGGDDGRAVAVDSSGNTYIAGYTQSTDFPVTNALQGTLTGTQNALIAKLNPTGSTVIFATYLGGSGTDVANGIGLDGSGNIHVAGTTSSTDFPLKNAAIPTFRGITGRSTGWVAELNAAGSALVYSTYLGGSGYEQVDALAADTAGNAYVTGGTSSVDFPVVNGYQTVSQNPAGFNQAFLTKLSSSGQITYSTITQSFGSDGAAVATDNNGVAVFANDTNYGTFGGLPIKNAFQPSLAGGLDVYVVKVDTRQTGAASLLFATYLGGSGNDAPKGIAMDTSGNVYVAGSTQSGNFPIANPYQSAPAVSFLTKIASSGSSMIFSTFLGGIGTAITSIATDASGNVYVIGQDNQFNSPLPILNPLPAQTPPNFVSAFSFTGSLIYSTYVGTGSGGMVTQAITASASGDVTLTGQASVGLPVTANAVQPNPNPNGANAFVLRLTFATPAVLSTSSVTPNQGGDTGFTSIAVRGVNILSGATLSLKSPSSTVVAFSSNVSADSRAIAGTFDLRQQPDGPYDVVVTNPDSTTATLPRAFTISLGGAPQIYVNILGASMVLGREGLTSQIQKGGTSTETIIVGNNGTADAFAVPVTAQVGSGVNVQLQATIAPPPQNAGLATIDYSQIPASFSTSTGTLIPLIIPWIPAGGTSYFRLTLNAPLTAPLGFSVPVTVYYGNPLLSVNPTGTPLSGGSVSPKLRLSPHPSLDARLGPQQLNPAQIVQQLFANPTGRNCLLNILQLVQQLLGLVPGVNCATSLLEQIMGTTMANEAVLILQGVSNNGSLSTSDVAQSQVQTSLSVLQIGVQCTKSINPAVNEILQAIQIAIAAASTYNACNPTATSIIAQIVSSNDPNSKSGPPGVGSQQWISSIASAPYNIQFENLATATAPAGKVVVTDQLNPQLYNLNQFSLGPISFGSTYLTPPPGSTSYSTQVDLRPAQNTLVAITAGISNTGLITWTFQSLDPISRQPVQNPQQGFLPPNFTPPQGQAYVTFSVPLLAGLATGTAISNQASVVFDFNAAILTNVWQNTIDSTPPASHVTTLSPNQASNVFTVNWSGSDIGSGIQNYTVFNSVNGGPFTPWITGATGTSASCVAAPNSTQAFFTIATDAAGNVELGKTSAETSTQVANVETVSVATNPPGLLVNVDSQTAQASPVSVLWTVGSQHTIATPAAQGSGSTLYAFGNWSDSGAISHTVTTTAGVPSYTANFNPSYLLTTSANPAQGGSVVVNTPGSNGYYASGTQVSLTATPNAGYSFVGWTGSIANTSAATTTTTMSQPQTIVANFSASSGTPSLGSAISTKSGSASARVWTITLTNGGGASAVGAQLTAFGLTQTFGASCTPAIGTPMPQTIGNIAPGATGSANVTINFSTCPANARFTVTYSYNATNVATASKSFLNQFQ